MTPLEKEALWLTIAGVVMAGLITILSLQFQPADAPRFVELRDVR